MSKESTSGDSTATSGAGNEDNQLNNIADASSDDALIPKSHVEKILKESRNKNAKIAELEAKLNALTEGQLNEQQQYKELADKRLERLQELETAAKLAAEQNEKAKKISSVKKHLIAMGLNAAHEDVVLGRMLDVSDLIVDPDTGVVLGAEEKAKSFRQEFGSLGFFGVSVPGTSHAAPQGDRSSNLDLKNMTQDEIRTQLRELAKQGV